VADQVVVMLTWRVTVDGLGRVAEARSMMGVVGGRVGGVARGAEPAGRATRAPAPFNEAFAKAATDAVRQWIYDPPAEAPISFDVTLAFAPGTETRLVAHGGAVSTGGRTAGFGE